MAFLRAMMLASVAAVVVSPASAQTSTVPDAPPSTPATVPDNGEIVVTAQRRSERLQDVPVSVTAIGAAALQAGGLTDVDSLTRAAPGVLIDRQGAYVQPTIRGIGTNVTGPSADPAVAIYVDGVYQPSGTSAFFDLPNVQQIEILKGPQGTLFGRNSTGGAILITTMEPSFTPSGRVTASYGNFNEASTSAYYTAGLNDILAFNLSAYYRHSDGWIRDLKTGAHRNRQHSLDLRGKALFKPTDRIDLTFIANYNDTSDPTGNAPIALNGNTGGRLLPGALPIATERGTLSADFPPLVRTKTSEYSLHGNIDLDFATLNTITAYRHENGVVKGDLDASYAALNHPNFGQNYRTFSQEGNLTSASGQPFTWVVGTYYFHQRAYNPYYTVTNVPFLNSQIKTDALSGFADGTYKFGDFSIFAGLRYSTEKKTLDYGAGAGPKTVHASDRFNKFTPRVGVRYALTPNSSVYASFNRGFKSGTYNSASSSTAAVKPEVVDSYEVGFKTASREFSLSTAAYYSTYSNIQVTAFDYTQGISRLFNAAKAKIYGGDIDLTYRPTSQLDLRIAGAYTHGEYNSFPGAVVFVPKPGGLTGNTTVLLDASGARMIRAPKFTLSGTATYRVPVGAGRIEFSASPYYSSNINFAFDERLQQKAYATLDANISYLPRDDVRFSVYGRNLTNHTYASFEAETSVRDSIVYARPRTYGVSASYKF